MSSRHELFTVGYAGQDLDSLLATLRQHGVEVVIDVRRNPISRKKGFSRSALSAFLLASKLEYLHERELGVPSDLRKRLRDGEQDLSSYLGDFQVYLNAHGDAVDRLYRLATGRRCCLLCVEQRSEECHRAVVAEAVASRNGRELRIIHL
jgi:uncharacterized protein (DUF488 family)